MQTVLYLFRGNSLEIIVIQAINKVAVVVVVAVINGFYATLTF
jgi:hypothetical protein